MWIAAETPMDVDKVLGRAEKDPPSSSSSIQTKALSTADQSVLYSQELLQM
jgi:hypothetical protein